jgi:hypothetical protein
MTSTRNLPIEIVCDNTRHRIINQAIIKESIHGGDWGDRARRFLKEHKISLSTSMLKKYRRKLLNGTRDPICSSDFGNNVIGSRYGKDMMYAEFNTIQNVFISEKKYVGLPANQILKVCKDYSKVIACEKNNDMFGFMSELINNFPVENVSLVNEDIFQYLKNTDEKFSVFDFDLMCHISLDVIKNICESLNNAAENKAVFNLATSFGRKITRKEYDDMMPHTLIMCINNDTDFEVKFNQSGSYNDHIIPMKYEMMYVERKNQ